MENQLPTTKQYGLMPAAAKPSTTVMAHTVDSATHDSISQPATDVSFKYRPDIDGIRALAVSAVVLFHAFPTTFPGGFVGVDVFFVISGFLISSIIFKGLASGAFSYLVFYSHRIKRIFPALLLVLAACILFGWFSLFTNEYASLGKHIAASAGFIENVQLWRESGYFDTDSSVKLLLHLWSLGIEEQFYVIWPLLLAFAYNRTRRVLHIIVGLLVASFALNIFQIGVHPTATFYLAFTRFWELLFGCLLAYIAFRAQSRITASITNNERLKVVSSLTSCSGLLLVGTSIVLLDSHKAFPGWWALLPAVGTFLLIWSGPDALINRKILAHPALVFVGLISYPIYLWHWPLLTFARIMDPDGPSLRLRVGLIILTVALAWLTYLFAEKPARFGNKKNVSVLLVALMVGMVIVGLVMKITNGFENVEGRRNILISDIESATLQVGYQACASSLNENTPILNYCLQSSASTPTAAVFGDSHADHIFPGIAQADKNRSWLLVGNSACPPVSGIDVQSETRDCQQRSEKAIRYLQEDKDIETVVLSFFASFFLDTDYAAGHLEKPDGPSKVKISSRAVPDYSKFDMAYYGLEKAISELERAGKRIVLIIDVPELPFEPQSCIIRPLTGEAARKDCSISRSSVLDRQSKFRLLLAKLESLHPRLRIYDSLDALCDGDRCWVERDGIMRYRDSHHLSLRGGDLLGSDFIKWLSHP